MTPAVNQGLVWLRNDMRYSCVVLIGMLAVPTYIEHTLMPTTYELNSWRASRILRKKLFRMSKAFVVVL